MNWQKKLRNSIFSLPSSSSSDEWIWKIGILYRIESRCIKPETNKKKRNEDQIQLGESGLLPNPSTTTTTKDWQTHGSSIHSLILIHCNICHLRFTSVKFSNVHHHHHHQWMMIVNDFWRLTNKQLELARLKMLVSLFSRNVQTHQGKKKYVFDVYYVLLKFIDEEKVDHWKLN